MSEQTTATPPFDTKELDWVWVLVSSQSPEDSAIFVVEMDDSVDGSHRRVVPIFLTREVALGLQGRLGGGPENSPHSMHLEDVGHFAAEHSLEIMLLNAEGGIMAHLGAEMATTQ